MFGHQIGADCAPTVVGLQSQSSHQPINHFLPWLIVVSVAGWTAAQPSADTADVALREAYVQQLTAESEAQKAEAVVWALQHGMPVYEDDGQKVRELMALRDGRPLYYTTTNVQAAASVATDRVRDILSWDLDGRGWAVGVWDSAGVRASHQEFLSPDGQSRVAVRDSLTTSVHATHVAGTIAAAGVDPKAKGMAPGARIESYDWNNDAAQMFSRAATAPGQPNSIYVSNHSYGFMVGWEYWIGLGSFDYPGWHWTGNWGGAGSTEDWFGQYNTIARQWDEVAHMNPYYLAFTAAGNDRSDGPQVGETVYYQSGTVWRPIVYSPQTCPRGDGEVKGGYDTISGQAVAKNIITVGAVHEALYGGTRSCTRAAMTTFSCWGPTDDGRIKPDIVANGVDLYSCGHSGSRDYRTMSGTSMASPTAAGSAVLLVQHYDRLFPGQAMRSSTLKGLILHTADDLGRVGPDYQYGWGLMNTRAAAELLQAHHDGPAGAMIVEDLLDSQDLVDSYYLYTDGTEPIRITLCWTDPPAGAIDALDNTARRLIHDLDLRLVGPGGPPAFYPYKLDPQDPGAVAGTGDNNLDNVEQIYLASPGRAGMYEVRVSTGGLASQVKQHYSLVSSVPLFNQRSPVTEDTQLVVAKNTPVTITLKARDEGLPNPPGRLTFAIESLPRHGTLEYPDGLAITKPMVLAQNSNQVIYRPAADFTGDDSFTYYADDGGSPPFGGASETATVILSVMDLTARQYQVGAGEDDVTGLPGYQISTGRTLSLGQYSSAMRFRNVEIPRDSRIIRAHLKLYLETTGKSSGAIHAEAAGDAQDFTTMSPRFYDRPRTEASVPWNWLGGENTRAWHTSPDLSNVIQEVIDRSDWSTGNALAIIYVGKDPSGQRTRFCSWECGPEYAVKLEITYAPRSGAGPVAPKEPGSIVPTAADAEIYVSAGMLAVVDLEAADDGLPAPLSFVIDTLPGHGTLEYPDRTVINGPGVLADHGYRVVYRPEAGFTGDDVFTFHADDGGQAPSGGRSNTAAVTTKVRSIITRQYHVIMPEDDAYGANGAPVVLSDMLSVGQDDSAMRFRNVDLLPADEIIGARLKINLGTAMPGRRIDGILRAHAVGDAADLTRVGGRIRDLPRTQANTPWVWQPGDGWPPETFCASPDIAAVVQEIVDRPDWSIDNSIMILYSGDGKAGGDLQFAACAGPYSDRAARLEVTYGLQTAMILPPAVNQTPPVAHDQVAETAFNAPLQVNLSATDDGLPDPPGGLTYTIASLPSHGSLEYPGGVWLAQPGLLPGSGNQVTYRPQPGFTGPDSFTFYVDDGDTVPGSAVSNSATVRIMVRPPLTPTLTIESRVARSEDDATAKRGSTSDGVADTILRVGVNASGMRFTGLNIPQGSKIIEARLTINLATRWLPQTVVGFIQAEATGDAADFAGMERLVCDLPLTDAWTDWVWDPGSYITSSWDRDYWRASPDIKAVIQEIVDRPDWASGNAMAIVFWSGNIPRTDLEFTAYDNTPGSSGSAPKLTIVYAPSQEASVPPVPVSQGAPIAVDLAVATLPESPALITLTATDDGLPNPPGRLTYAIDALPSHGTLEYPAGGAMAQPGALPDSGNQVVYRPGAAFRGEDSFTFHADDGGAPPSGGASNTATVKVTVEAPILNTVTRTFKVAKREDDASATARNPWNSIYDTSLKVGLNTAAMRFANVDIPPGSRILKANLSISLLSNNIESHIEGIVQAEAVGDAANFLGAERYLCQLPRTEASAPWVWEPGNYPGYNQGKDWTAGPDIAPVIQEIVNRPDWAAGNALALIYSCRNSPSQELEFQAYDSAPTYGPTYGRHCPPMLQVTYAP